MHVLLWGLTAQAIPKSYSQLLAQHVDEKGRVHYENWRSDPLYQKLMQELPTYPTPTDDTAYWINVYNALTIHTIIEHYPVRSIRDIADGTVWSTQKFSLAGGTYTLDDIEHKILRPRKDPRVHAALNCASIGCPPLWNKPFVEDNIDTQLNQAVERWLDYNAYRKDSGTIQISKIFSWYAKDFTPNPIEYLRTLRPKESWPSWEQTQFIPYDWSLNKAP